MDFTRDKNLTTDRVPIRPSIEAGSGGTTSPYRCRIRDPVAASVFGGSLSTKRIHCPFLIKTGDDLCDGVTPPEASVETVNVLLPRLALAVTEANRVSAVIGSRPVTLIRPGLKAH